MYYYYATFLSIHVQIYKQRDLFGILLHQTEIRLYSPFSDKFRTKRINQKIQYDFGLFRKFGEDFSVCNATRYRADLYDAKGMAFACRY